MKKLWLIFAQAVTASLGVWFVIGVFRPEWAPTAPRHPQAAPVVTIRETASSVPALRGARSYSDAVQHAVPSVVNVFSTKAVRRQNQLLDDPVLRRFFGDRNDGWVPA